MNFVAKSDKLHVRFKWHCKTFSSKTWTIQIGATVFVYKDRILFSCLICIDVKLVSCNDCLKIRPWSKLYQRWWRSKNGSQYVFSINQYEYYGVLMVLTSVLVITWFSRKNAFRIHWIRKKSWKVTEFKCEMFIFKYRMSV